MKNLFIMCILCTIFSMSIFAQAQDQVHGMGSTFSEDVQPVTVTKEKRKRGKGDITIAIVNNLPSESRGGNRDVIFDEGIAQVTCYFQVICTTPDFPTEFQIGMLVDSLSAIEEKVGYNRCMPMIMTVKKDSVIQVPSDKGAFQAGALRNILKNHFENEANKELEAKKFRVRPMVPWVDEQIAGLVVWMKEYGTERIDEEYLVQLNRYLESYYKIRAQVMN